MHDYPSLTPPCEGGARNNAAGDLEAQQISHELVDKVMSVFTTYRLDEIEAIHAVRGLRSIVHGFVMLENAGGFGMPVGRQDSFKFLTETFLIGLNARCE